MRGERLKREMLAVGEGCVEEKSVEEKRDMKGREQGETQRG